MQRKYILLFFSFFGSAFLMLFTESCLRHKAKVCDVQFSGNVNNRQSTDTHDSLLTSFEFRVRGKGAKATCYNPVQSLVPMAYAFKKCANWKNLILQNTFRLSFSRPFIVDSDTIHANEDLFQHPFFRTNFVIEEEEACEDVLIIIRVDSNLRERMVFETGQYTGTFFCQTNDAKEFTSRRNFVFKK